MKACPSGFLFVGTMPAAGVTAVATAEMISLRKDHVRALHVEVFRAKEVVLCRGVGRLEGSFRFELRVARVTHGKSLGDTTTCAVRAGTAAARSMSAIERLRFGETIAGADASSSTTAPLRN